MQRPWKHPSIQLIMKIIVTIVYLLRSLRYHFLQTNWSFWISAAAWEQHTVAKKAEHGSSSGRSAGAGRSGRGSEWASPGHVPDLIIIIIIIMHHRRIQYYEVVIIMIILIIGIIRVPSPSAWILLLHWHRFSTLRIRQSMGARGIAQTIMPRAVGWQS